MEYIKRNHEEYVFQDWRNVEKVPGSDLREFVVDLDRPVPAILFDRPDFQLTLDYGAPNIQEWEFDGKEITEGDLTQLRFRFIGASPTQYQKLRCVALRIKPPWNPGRYFPASAGQHNETLIQDAGREDIEDLECPECEAYLAPIPDKCPQCGHKVWAEVPSLGELVERYGPDAHIGTHTSYATIEVWVTYTRTQEEADRINAEQGKKHAEKVAFYEKKLAAWNRLIEPWVKKEEAQREAEEREEFERLKTKFAEG